MDPSSLPRSHRVTVQAPDSTPAYLLRSVDYRDADRILTFFTLRLGRVSALARGARSSRRRFPGALEPFALIEIRVSGRPTGMLHLAEAKVVAAYPRLLSSLARMNEAGAALEDLRALLPENTEEPELFAATARLLEVIDSCEEAQLGLARSAYVARALALSGLFPNLTQCGHCGRIAAPSQSAMFDPAAGQLVCRNCGRAPVRLTGTCRGLMARAADVGASLALDEPVTAETGAELSEAIRAIMRAHGARA